MGTNDQIMEGGEKVSRKHFTLIRTVNLRSFPGRGGRHT